MRIAYSKQLRLDTVPIPNVELNLQSRDRLVPVQPQCDVKGDNLSLSFPTASSVEVVAELIDGLQLDAIHPVPNIDAMENLKFSECLSPEIAAEVFMSRFDDRNAVNQALAEPRRETVCH